jgi:hypothetical protein
MVQRTLLLTLAVTFSFAFVAAVVAQDEEVETEAATPSPTEAAPTPEGPPTASGRSEVNAVVGPRGMTFELHSKARVFIPAGLPTGTGRRISFAEVRGRVDADQVAPGFTRLGNLMSFNGALNATSNPIIVSIRQTSDPRRDNRRVVLAMEQPTICREGLSPLEGAGGLCSGWELIEASYDEGERRLSAPMTTPGGHRLMFGWIPVATE